MGKLGISVVAALALILSAPAAANHRRAWRSTSTGTTTIPAGALCSFEFVVRSEGDRTTTTYTNSDGSLDRFTIHLTSWHTTYTNPANGNMLRVTFSGPVIVEALPGRPGACPDSRQRPAHRREGRGPDLHRQRADRLHRAGPRELGRAARGTPCRRRPAARARTSSQPSAARPPDTLSRRPPPRRGPSVKRLLPPVMGQVGGRHAPLVRRLTSLVRVWSGPTELYRSNDARENACLK